MKTIILLILQSLFIYTYSLRPFQNQYNKKYTKCPLNNLDKIDSLYLINFEKLWSAYENDSNPPVNIEKHNKKLLDFKKYDKFIPINKK